MKNPDRHETEADEDIEFIRTLKGRKVHVIANYLEDQDKWLVKTTWVRGEDDDEFATKRNKSKASKSNKSNKDVNPSFKQIALIMTVLRFIMQFLKRKR